MKDKSKQNIYTEIQRFADITKALIIQGNIGRAKRCLKVAEEIFNKGTVEIKNAMASIYVFSVSTFMEIHHCNIKNLFPESLHNTYQKQIMANYP